MRLRTQLHHFRQEEGQAIVLVALALGMFLTVATGLAIDGSHLYAQRQMAQAAADSAAQAAMLSVYNGTNTAGTAQFSTTAGFNCSGITSTPCAYASKNGFSSTNGDTIAVSYPAAASFPGVTLSATTSAPVSLLQVTVSRSVTTTLMKFAGTAATTISATATAAIVSVTSPTPILVTHPTLAGALYLNGNTSVQICGGPTRSIQVNSTSASGITTKGNPSIDLSKAGPADNFSSPCTSGTGADFAASGADPNPGGLSLGSTGHYLAPVSYIEDPYANVAVPSEPATAGTSANIANGTHGCTQSGGCVEYHPGYYDSLVPGNNSVIFDPGLYWIRGGGFTLKHTTGGGTGNNAMCVGCTADPNTGTGMVVYDTTTDATPAYSSPAHTNRPTGGFTIDTNVSVVLKGSTLTTTNSSGQTVPAAPYYGLLFWEDRTANAQIHSLGQGNGCFTLVGTIYITNTRAMMLADSTRYQGVAYAGNPCSATVFQGEIIVGTLELKGTSGISMELVPYGFLNVSKVSLVN